MKKSQKLQDAIGMVGDDLIHRADAPRKRIRLRRWAVPAVAAMLVLTILAGMFFVGPGRHLFDQNRIEDPTHNGITDPAEPDGGSQIQEPSAPQAGGSAPGNQSAPIRVQTLAAATYPQSPIYVGAVADRNDRFSEISGKWHKQNNIRKEQAQSAGTINGFVEDTLTEFLAGEENRVYSPLNLYISLAMVAEMANGNSRQQILDLLNVQDMDTLRQKAYDLWNAHYRDDGAITSVMANSLWLNEKETYNEEMIQTLARQYYTSVYSGKPGTKAFDQALQQWINTQTGGHLGDLVQEFETDPSLVFSLVSTVHFRGKWKWPFDESKTKQGIFHGVTGDNTCDFLNTTYNEKVVYYGDRFTAVFHEIATGGGMWLILPDEGVTIEQLTNDPQVRALMAGQAAEDTLKMTVHLSVPKFDVSAKIDLIEPLKNLGVTDIFIGGKADLSSLGSGGLVVYEANHSARVTIDEEGCIASSFTNFDGTKSVPKPGEELTFTLDRPFLYTITSEHGTTLFAGTVQNP